MKKIVSLLKLYVPKTYSSILMLAMMGFSIFFTIHALPCEQLDTPKDYATSNSYICINPDFHQFSVDLSFLIPLILITIFISINANYFLLALHSCRERISSDLEINEYLKDLTLLTSVGIPQKIIFKGIFILKGLVLLLSVFLLNFFRIIIFFRTSKWTGISLNTLILGILLAICIALIIHIIMSTFPNINLLFNIFSFIASMVISLFSILGFKTIIDFLYFSVYTDSSSLNNFLSLFNSFNIISFNTFILLISLVIFACIFYIYKSYNRVSTHKNKLRIIDTKSTNKNMVQKSILILILLIVFFIIAIYFIPVFQRGISYYFLNGLIIAQLLNTITTLKNSKKTD